MAQDIGTPFGPQLAPAVGTTPPTPDAIPFDPSTIPHYPSSTPDRSVGSTALPDLPQLVATEVGTFLDDVKPGWQTSEAKITAGALFVVNVLFTLFLAGVFGHTDQATVMTATAVDGAVTALLTGTYTKKRSDLKAAVATARVAAATNSTG